MGLLYVAGWQNDAKQVISEVFYEDFPNSSFLKLMAGPFNALIVSFQRALPLYS